MERRPHTLNWKTPDGESTIDPVTGYPVPGTPGLVKSVPCRFHLGGIKVFKNEDSTEVNQVGTIRVDIGSDMPEVGQIVDVPGYFNGRIRAKYTGGQLISWRMDV